MDITLSPLSPSSAIDVTLLQDRLMVEHMQGNMPQQWRLQYALYMHLVVHCALLIS